MLDHSIMIIAICVMRGCSVRRNKFTCWNNVFELRRLIDIIIICFYYTFTKIVLL